MLTALTWLMPRETAAISAQVLCTPYNHAPCHFMQNHIRKVDACLAVKCHLHFWQNDRDLLHATAVTRGWNRYRKCTPHQLTKGLSQGSLLSSLRSSAVCLLCRVSSNQLYTSLGLSPSMLSRLPPLILFSFVSIIVIHSLLTAPKIWSV